MMSRMCIVCGERVDEYGRDGHGHAICYECCGLLDRRKLCRMKAGDRTALYVVQDWESEGGLTRRWWVVNWPDTLRLRAVLIGEGRHNIAGVQRHFNFFLRSSEGEALFFHGVNFGHDTQVLHVRRVRGEGVVV